MERVVEKEREERERGRDKRGEERDKRGEERDCANMFIVYYVVQIILFFLTQEQSLILVTKYFSQKNV